MFGAFALIFLVFLEFSLIPPLFPELFWPLSLLLGPSFSSRDPWLGVWWFISWGVMAFFIGTPSVPYLLGHFLAAPVSYVLSTVFLAKRSLWSQTFGAALIGLVIIPFILPYQSGYQISFSYLALGYALTVLSAFVYTKLANLRRRFFI